MGIIARIIPLGDIAISLSRINPEIVRYTPQVEQDPPLQVPQPLEALLPATTRPPLCANAAETARWVSSLWQFSQAIGSSAFEKLRRTSNFVLQLVHTYS